MLTFELADSKAFFVPEIDPALFTRRVEPHSVNGRMPNGLLAGTRSLHAPRRINDVSMPVTSRHENPNKYVVVVDAPF